MSQALPERIVARIESEPRSGSALLLYGLLRSVLASGERALLALGQLRRLSPADRALVYELLEAYASEGLTDPAWEAALGRLDRLMQA